MERPAPPSILWHVRSNNLVEHSGYFSDMEKLTFSVKTKQLNRPAHCSGDNGLNTPLKISSVNSSSSPVLISHATRPFISTISADVVNPSRRRTRFRHLSSSICKTSCVDCMRLLNARIRTLVSCFVEYNLYSSGSRGSL